MKKLSSLLLLVGMCMFTMSMYAQTPAGYTIFGSNPEGYTDLTTSVTAQAMGTAGWEANTLTGKGLPGRICETGNYLQMSFNAATTMTLTENYAIHIKLAKVGEAAGDVQLSFCKGGWNAVRVSYIIPNASIGTDATDIVLNYADRNTGNWNSFGESGTIGTVEYPAGEIFRICAANAEQFVISQIYITANAISGDDEAPTNLTAVLKDGSLTGSAAVITASAEDENAITFNVYNGENVIATATSTSGVAKDIEITGLTPNTAYSLDVEAVDAAGNVNPTKVAVTFTTPEEKMKRFYFFRAGDLPQSDTIEMVDLRDGAGTTIQTNNMAKGEATDYTAYILNGQWFSFNQNLKAATDMSVVNQATWYLVIKMRTSNTNQSFNIRLNNAGECYQVSQGNLTVSAEWQELQLALADSKKTLSFSNKMTGTVFQMHANGSVAEDNLDIMYAYLTNDPTIPEDLHPITPDPTGLNKVMNSNKVTKMFINGRMIIVRDGQPFDILGKMLR